MTIKFVSSKVFNETCIMHTEKDNIKVMMDNDTDEIIKELFNSLLKKFPKKTTKTNRRINKRK